MIPKLHLSVLLNYECLIRSMLAVNRLCNTPIWTLMAFLRVSALNDWGAQVKLLRQRFEEALGAEYKKFVDIDTIDGFQVSIGLPPTLGAGIQP